MFFCMVAQGSDDFKVQILGRDDCWFESEVKEAIYLHLD